VVLKRVWETWRTRRLKKEHEAYIKEHQIHPVREFWKTLEDHDKEWAQEVRKRIDELHRKNIGSLVYRPSREDVKTLQRVAKEIHERVGQNPPDSRMWEAIIHTLDNYEEPYNTLGKLLRELRKAKE